MEELGGGWGKRKREERNLFEEIVSGKRKRKGNIRVGVEVTEIFVASVVTSSPIAGPARKSRLHQS